MPFYRIHLPEGQTRVVEADTARDAALAHYLTLQASEHLRFTPTRDPDVLIAHLSERTGGRSVNLERLVIKPAGQDEQRTPWTVRIGHQRAGQLDHEPRITPPGDPMNAVFSPERMLREIEPMLHTGTVRVLRQNPSDAPAATALPAPPEPPAPQPPAPQPLPDHLLGRAARTTQDLNAQAPAQQTDPTPPDRQAAEPTVEYVLH